VAVTGPARKTTPPPARRRREGASGSDAAAAPAPPAGAADAPLPVHGLEGTIVRAPFGSGTRSQRQAFWLQTAEGRYLLRRKAGPSFGNDPVLEKLLGQPVEVCSGFLTGYQVLAEQLKPKKPR
jgi:hypothetical protein